MIANGWSPADVGTAAPLAASLDGTVLFASKDSLGGPTSSALVDLKPATVILLGGTAALTPGIESEIRQVVPDSRLHRLSGSDRLDTAAKAARYVADNPSASPQGGTGSSDSSALVARIARLETRLGQLENANRSAVSAIDPDCLSNHYHEARGHSPFSMAWDHTHRLPYSEWDPSTGNAEWTSFLAAETSRTKYPPGYRCPN